MFPHPATLPHTQLRPPLFAHCAHPTTLDAPPLPRQVDTDMESLYLRKKKAEFKFSLHVPDKGASSTLHCPHAHTHPHSSLCGC